MLISCRRQSGRQINSFCMLFIGLFAMIPSDSCWKTMNSHGLFGLTYCIAGRDYPAAATCVKHLVHCMDAAFYIRLSAARCTESVILGKKKRQKILLLPICRHAFQCHCDSGRNFKERTHGLSSWQAAKEHKEPWKRGDQTLNYGASATCGVL